MYILHNMNTNNANLMKLFNEVDKMCKLEVVTNSRMEELKQLIKCVFNDKVIMSYLYSWLDINKEMALKTFMNKENIDIDYSEIIQKCILTDETKRKSFEFIKLYVSENIYNEFMERVTVIMKKTASLTKLLKN